jgi:hypothetical protein
MEHIDVGHDIARACDAVGASRDQRALLSVLYNEAVSEVEAGQILGWQPRRLERAARSLRADRRIGAGLREHLAAYAPKKKNNLSAKLQIRPHDGNGS